MRSHVAMVGFSFFLAIAVQDASAAPARGCLTPTGEATGSLRLIDPTEQKSCATGEMQVDLAGSAFRWRGDWSPQTAYEIGDAVSYAGSSYIAIRKNRAARPSASEKWDQLASKGEVGPKGERGVAGKDGPKGDKGDRGPQGGIGPQGLPGPRGDRGLTGPQGDQGVSGPVGPAGAQGPAGPGAIVGGRGKVFNISGSGEKNLSFFEVTASESDLSCQILSTVKMYYSDAPPSNAGVGSSILIKEGALLAYDYTPIFSAGVNFSIPTVLIENLSVSKNQTEKVSIYFYHNYELDGEMTASANYVCFKSN